MNNRVLFVAAVATLSLVPAEMQASRESIVTAVSSKVAKDYHRELSEDGSPKPEYYAIVNGKYMAGALADKSIDDVKFPTIANLLARYLARQSYYPAPDMESAQLLLVVSWGTTLPFNDNLYRNGVDQFYNALNVSNSATAAAAASPGLTIEGIQSNQASVAQAARSDSEQMMLQMAMYEDMRMKANEQNARLLGYIEEINYRNNPSRFGGAGDAYNDLIFDIENERYFVIVAAYDFQVAIKEKQSKPMWITRISVQKDGNQFDKVLAQMVARASDYFGQESKRLVRRYYDGRVTFGDLKVIGVADEEDQKPQDEPAKQP